jgi:hypothetical protein
MRSIVSGCVYQERALLKKWKLTANTINAHSVLLKNSARQPPTRTECRLLVHVVWFFRFADQLGTNRAVAILRPSITELGEEIDVGELPSRVEAILIDNRICMFPKNGATPKTKWR